MTGNRKYKLTENGIQITIDGKPTEYRFRYCRLDDEEGEFVLVELTKKKGGVIYHLVIDPRKRRAVCDCKGWMVRKGCKHVAVALQIAGLMRNPYSKTAHPPELACRAKSSITLRR